jgi:hypothetical protein
LAARIEAAMNQLSRARASPCRASSRSP